MDHPLSKWDSNKIFWLFVTLHVKYFLSLHRKSIWKVRGKNVTVQFYFVGAMLMRKQTSQTLSHKAWNNILSILPFASVYQPLHTPKKKFSSKEDCSIGKTVQLSYQKPTAISLSSTGETVKEGNVLEQWAIFLSFICLYLDPLFKIFMVSYWST